MSETLPYRTFLTQFIPDKDFKNIMETGHGSLCENMFEEISAHEPSVLPSVGVHQLSLIHI